MMKRSKKVVFFGNERLATGVTTSAPTLQALIKAGYKVCAVVLNNETAVSRAKRPLEITKVAEDHNIPVLFSGKPVESLSAVAAFQAEAGILVAYGKIIPQEVIDIFPAGIVNIHPSLLPKHRGPIPIESVLLNGEPETGVSIMRLEREMDAGPVYARRTISVPGKISKQELSERLLKMGSEMLVQYLPAILDSSLVPQTQNHAEATYDSLIAKTNGVVDWTKPAVVLEREVRAYASWPKSKATIGGQTVTITKADVEKTSGNPGDYVIDRNKLLVHCGVDSLQILRLQPENKKEMPIQAFLQGYSL